MILVITLKFLTLSKVRLKRDIKQRFFRDTRNVDIVAFDRDLLETLNSSPIQDSKWNVKLDFAVRSKRSLGDTYMLVRKYTKGNINLT